MGMGMAKVANVILLGCEGKEASNFLVHLNRRGSQAKIKIKRWKKIDNVCKLRI